jgi:hypothetical protein
MLEASVDNDLTEGNIFVLLNGSCSIDDDSDYLDYYVDHLLVTPSGDPDIHEFAAKYFPSR